MFLFFDFLLYLYVFVVHICLYLLYSPAAQGSVASAPPPTAPPIAPPPAAAAGERSRVIVFVRGGNHHHHHSPVSRETSFPLETLCRIRPDICHEYHELYSWRKNCHVEKFQLSMYDNSGEIKKFSTDGKISVQLMGFYCNLCRFVAESLIHAVLS